MAVASKFKIGVKNDEFRARLATHYTPLSTILPTLEELRLKSKEYLLLKPPIRSGYYKNNYGNFNSRAANQDSNWYKPRDDMDKRRPCANSSSTEHHVSACPTYKQGLKAIGFSLEDEYASEFDHEDFMREIILRFVPMCSFATWRVISHRIVHNFGFLWQTSSTQFMKKLYQVSKPARHA